MSEERCQIVLPKQYFRGVQVVYDRVCGRLMTDQCSMCRAYDAHKDQWTAVFEELRNLPRKAVDGDIL